MPPTIQEIVAAEVRRLSCGAPVAVSLRDGVATLTGYVPSDTRRRLIEQGLLQLPEVDDVRNYLTLPPPVGDVHRQLEEVLTRQGVDIDDLRIGVSGGQITLDGRAEGWFDRDAAGRLAWELPGVKTVINRIALKEGAVEPEADQDQPS